MYCYHVLNVTRYCTVNGLEQKIPCINMRCLREIIACFSQFIQTL